MSKPEIRDVALWSADIEWETRPDGAILIWQTEPLPDYPRCLSERIHHWADQDPDRVWMAERGPDGDWVKMTFAEMLRAIRSIGQGLLSLGLSTDRPLVILSDNSIAHALMALAAQYVGVPSAALAPAYARAESSGFEKLREVAHQITPGAVFAENLDDFRPALAAVFADIPHLGKSGAADGRSLDDLAALDAGTDVDAANAAITPDTVAKFMFTSGTTGAPKAVIQTQRMLCSNMEMVLDCYAYMKDEPPIVVDWAPWNHVASGNKVFNLTIYAGGTFYVDRGKPTPQLIGETIRNLREVSPNWYFNVPAGYEMLVEAMKSDKALAESFFRDLKMIMYAGAAMAEHTWADLERISAEVTGKRVFMASGLGATETAPFALFSTSHSDVPGNVGLPSKGLTLKLVPMDGKWDARLKGPSVTPGYWRNEQLTRDAFDDEGFYKFGDALRFADPDDPRKGFFFDGRTAENFKMSTGTWVGVGALRAKLIDALGGLARDVVIDGEGRAELGALLVPFRPALERLVDGGAGMSDDDLYAAAPVREALAAKLGDWNTKAGGASMRVPRALILSEALDLDKGEVTDKGSVNQRAVLRHRGDLVEALFSDDPRVIKATRKAKA